MIGGGAEAAEGSGQDGRALTGGGGGGSKVPKLAVRGASLNKIQDSEGANQRQR